VWGALCPGCPGWQRRPGTAFAAAPARAGQAAPAPTTALHVSRISPSEPGNDGARVSNAAQSAGSSPSAPVGPQAQPGRPIDAETHKTHGLTDEEVAGSQTFVQVEPELTRLLANRDGEQLVLVAHNAPFDVSRLKLEYERAGKAMPDLAVLDTMALAKYVRLRTGDLASLVGALNIVNSKPHSALGDANATARAVIAMLVTTAERTQDFDALLVQVMSRRKSRTGDINVGGGKRRRPRTDDIAEPGIDLPAAHILGHAELLPEQPTAADLATWTAQVSECAQLRCPYLKDRVDVASLPPREVLTLLEPVLDSALRGGHPAVVATLLGAVLLVIDGLGNRRAALRWHKTWGPRLDTASACTMGDACPAYRADQPWTPGTTPPRRSPSGR